MSNDFFDRFQNPDPGEVGRGINLLGQFLGFFLKRPKLLGFIFVVLALLGAAQNSKDFILLPLSLALIWFGVILRRQGR